jgi:hypothetical protein
MALAEPAATAADYFILAQLCLSRAAVARRRETAAVLERMADEYLRMAAEMGWSDFSGPIPPRHTSK